ncbi:MAG TPA: MarR family transcriptional regulator [Actinomycetes bacterium]|jgi:DNA-binding MarR family transcriptional regulator|nr:MarR family transcriptional regulator [Actinomycetes bacterium]
MVQGAPIRVEADHARRYPGADKLATECMVNLIRTENLVSAEVNGRFRRFGLTGSTFNVLMILNDATEPLSPHQLGERLLVTRGTVTGLLDTLQRQGLVRRVPHPGDRRMLLIELTQTGRTVLRKTWRTHFPAQTEMMSVLSDPEKETLLRLLGKLQAHLEARAVQARA